METPRRFTSRRFCNIDCAKQRISATFNSTSKLTHAEREYRLPLAANIEPLSAAISIALKEQISSARSSAYFQLSIVHNIQLSIFTFQLSTLPLRFSTIPFITAAAPYKKNSVPQIR